ncbi:MAG TPA: ABC transporter ATP-binding protein [Terriglobales bacterium]|nr:ABC transporter ATP-binding protein [Terriglobales bacterium]
MIEVRGLRKRYGRRLALDHLDFAVPEGEIFGFLGPNGAGKTTTLRILATLTPPDGGTAVIGGVRVDSRPFAVRRLIGYMPDFFGVYDRLNVVEYLDFYASCYDVRPGAAGAWRASSWNWSTWRTAPATRSTR